MLKVNKEDTRMTTLTFLLELGDERKMKTNVEISQERYCCYYFQGKLKYELQNLGFIDNFIAYVCCSYVEFLPMR